MNHVAGCSHFRRTARLCIAAAAAGLFAAACTPNLTQPQPGLTGPGPQTQARPEPEPPPPPPRQVWPPKAVWVVRRAYASPQQIADVMEQCRQAGFNTVLYQVRGNGTAHYRSRIEPFTEEYRNGDPGFDPLTVACREAHRRGMAIHAWVNVMPAWRGDKPPPWPEHIYHTHPEWFWYDQNGKRQPLEKWYVSVNPCLPEVRQYLVRVFEEIVRNYPVDGLHLDYIRFPAEESPKGSDYPNDARTLDLFRKATGKTPRQDRAAWTRWRTEQVTQLVRDIRFMMRRSRPTAKLTAACWADLEGVRKSYYQDGAAWVRGNLVDLVFVMNYTANTRVFQQRQDVWRRATAGHPVAAGVIVRKDSEKAAVEQIRMARAWGGGLAVFSYQSVFASPQQARDWIQTLRNLLLSPQPKPPR